MKKKFLVSFLVSLLVFGLLFGWLYIKIKTSKSHMQSLEEGMEIDSLDRIEEGNEISQKNPDELLFLLVGVDTSSLDQIRPGENGETGIRSDTMILCKFNFQDASIKMLSIPRDSRVPVKGRLDKLNHAHSYGGMRLLMQTIRDYTGLDIDYYVRVDYGAVKAIVDAIGGLELEITEEMKYSDSTQGMELYIDFQPGVQRLDGQKAIEYLRYRSYKEGDIRRVENQQYFMKELIGQILRPRNILKLPRLLDVYSNYVDSNIGPSIILDGIWAAPKIDKDRIETMTLPGSGQYINKISYYVLDQEGVDQMIRENFSEYLREQR